MKKLYCNIILAATVVLSCILTAAANPDGYKISGRIVDARDGAEISGAAIAVENSFLWAVSDAKGGFSISGIEAGTYRLTVSASGYTPAEAELTVSGDINGLIIALFENSLALDEVIVTAQAAGNVPNTVFVIGSDALRHMQVSNVADVAALLPGGKTVNPDLTSNNTFSLRDGNSSAGNAAFGTAVEVDGVRLSNNASFATPDGIGTRNIAAADIESVEVITGVPSAEYGDLNSGMVRINTRRGHTAWNVLLAVNPRTQQTALSKGFDLGGNGGTLNISAEWARAIKKPISPYSSYTRRGISATYGNTFRRVLKFEAGITGNIGGMNTEDDPDAYSGEYTTERDNVLRANTSLTWLLNRSWITNLKFDASVNLADNRLHARLWNSNSSEQPAVHAESEGYFIAGQLPYSYFSDKIVDSRELDYAASLKYEWNVRRNNFRNNLKAGVQWKANGNTGDGEYYIDPALAPSGYRPRPYSSYPFMHNISLYVEDNFAFPVGRTSLELTAGVRFENVIIKGTDYRNLHTLSPRLNARWKLTRNLSVRGGWGVTEKLPSFYVLFPQQEYRDTRTFDISYDNNRSLYVYHTQPYTMLHNAELKWQRNNNAEIGVDADFAGFSVSVVGYFNRTRLPYKYSNAYSPFAYNVVQIPSGYDIPANPEIKVDSQTGMVYIRGGQDDYWTAMDVKVTDRTFVRSTMADNGADVIRRGVETVVDFPEINPIRTRFRFDAAYGYTKYVDNSLSWYYQTGWSHSSIPNRSYQYAGIYATGGGSGTANGQRTHSLDANITAVTHIPRARLVISCRLEMALIRRSQNLSEYGGREYAFNVSQDGLDATGGSIYDGNSYTAIWPVAYVDLDGTVRPFTAADAANPELQNLIVKSGNAYTFAPDGYGAYMSANLSITKEIGNHVSLSFFANNFTNSRRYVTSFATGVSAIFTPNFYYGLTCRLKF